MKFLLPLALVSVFALSACNTIENRRSLYWNNKVHGPYTRELEEGTWGHSKTIHDQYAEQQSSERYPKLVPGAKRSSGSSGGSSVPAADPGPLPGEG